MQVTALQIVTLIVAILGLVTAGVSLTWNVLLFRLQGARPKVKTIAGVLDPAGVISCPAVTAMIPALKKTLADLGGVPVIGIEIVNTGRMALHVQDWSLTAEPSEITLKGFEVIAGPSSPFEVAPGASVTLVAELTRARQLVYAARETMGKTQYLRCSIASGDKRYSADKVTEDVLRFAD